MYNYLSVLLREGPEVDLEAIWPDALSGTALAPQAWPFAALPSQSPDVLSDIAGCSNNMQLQPPPPPATG